MTWVRLDDAFPDHPKVDRLSDGAFRLHVAALCHSGRHLTDGYVDAARVSRLVPRYRQTHVAELVTAGLWHDREGGWEINDYLAYNPSAEKVAAERAAAAERMRRRRSPRSSPEHPGERSGGCSPSPSRPVPLVENSVLPVGTPGRPPDDDPIEVEAARRTAARRPDDPDAYRRAVAAELRRTGWTPPPSDSTSAHLPDVTDVVAKAMPADHEIAPPPPDLRARIKANRRSETP